jgi:CRISPR-associated endonuclease Csn1
MVTMRYRLALDLGSTSLGWAMIRLAADDTPCAVIKAGVRIFSNGREPAGKGEVGTSLAATRREARAMRRRRDRLLKRKARMTRTLVQHGFFPRDEAARKALERLDPYALRAKGLDSALTGPDFARALFHINQRRGFKSNRKTDKKDNDSGALKQSIRQLRDALQAEQCRTVGEWLHRRHSAGQGVRARLRQTPVTRDNGKTGIDKRYDLYIDRAMIEAEFDALWANQASLNPALYTETARADLKDALLHQRPLKPVKPGRCTLLPEQERAPLALPSTQRFRIYQEINHLRVLHPDLQERALTRHERDLLADALEHNSKRTFGQITKLLGLGSGVKFNLEDAKRTELKGNTTSAILSGKNGFGPAWFSWDEAQQDAIVCQLVSEESEGRLVRWLMEHTGVDEARAETIANTGLPEGYGSLSAAALARILPELRREVVSFTEAAQAAGFNTNQLSGNTETPGKTHPVEVTNATTGEIKTFHAFNKLPY